MMFWVKNEPERRTGMKKLRISVIFLLLGLILFLFPAAVSAADPDPNAEINKYKTSVTLEFDPSRGDDADVTDLVLVLKENELPSEGITVLPVGVSPNWKNSLDMGGGDLLTADATGVYAPKPNWTGVEDDKTTVEVNENLQTVVHFTLSYGATIADLYVTVSIEPVPASTVIKKINDAADVAAVKSILDEEGLRNNFGAERDYVKYWYDADSETGVFTEAEKTAVSTAVFNGGANYTLNPAGQTALIDAYEGACRQIFADRITEVSNGNHLSLVLEMAGITDNLTNKTTLPVPSDGIDALVDAAKDAEDEGDDPVIAIKLNASADTVTTEFSIPRSGLNQIADETTAGIRVGSDTLGSITFDADAVDAIDNATDNGDITITSTAVDVEDLSSDMQEIVGDRPVYDFTVKAGESAVSDFGDGTAKIRIPYTLREGEDANAVVVYYLGDDGTLELVRGSYNANNETVTFTVSHFSQYVVGYNEITFADNASGEWYYNAVRFIAARGITKGTDANHYSPGSAITRGQFIVMLMRAYGIGPDETPADNFADAGDCYYTNYLAAAKRLGISNGIGENLFAPENKISRQDLFTLLYRTLNILGELPEASVDADLTDFSDGDCVASYAQDPLKALVKGGIVAGSNGKLLPLNNASRAEMAMVFYRLLSAE